MRYEARFVIDRCTRVLCAYGTREHAARMIARYVNAINGVFVRPKTIARRLRRVLL